MMDVVVCVRLKGEGRRRKREVFKGKGKLGFMAQEENYKNAYEVFLFVWSFFLIKHSIILIQFKL